MLKWNDKLKVYGGGYKNNVRLSPSSIGFIRGPNKLFVQLFYFAYKNTWTDTLTDVQLDGHP